MRASEAQSILDAFGYLQHGLVTSAQAPWEGVLRQNAELAARIASPLDPSWISGLGKSAAHQEGLDHGRELSTGSTETPRSGHDDDGRNENTDD